MELSAERIAPTPPASPPVPTLRQRWIGAVPLFMIFFVNLFSTARYQVLIQEYRRYRIDLPLPTHLALAWSNVLADYSFIWLPIMLAACYFYFAWAARTHRRLLWANLLCTALLLFSTVVMVGGMFLPYMKIQDHLRKK